MSRNRLVLGLSTLLVLAAAYSLYWFHAAGQVRKSIAAWSEDRRAAGWQVEYRDLTVDGFPGRISVRLEAPSIVAPGGFGWRAESLAASVWPLDLGHPHLGAAGRHAFGAGNWRGEIGFSDLQADLGFDGGRLRDFRASAGGIDVGGTGISAEALTLTLTFGQPDLIFAVSGSGLVPPPLPDLGLDRRIARLEIGGRLRGHVPAGTPMAALIAWSADGGTIEIERLQLDWAPLGLEGDGTLALDSGLQPLAAFSARVRGTAPLLDRLAESRRIEPGAILAAKTLLALMSKPDSQGRAALPVPITVQDGQMWLGPARVARVPPIDWPAAPAR